MIAIMKNNNDTQWPIEVYSAEQCRALDQAAMKSGVSGEALMEHAGKAAFQLARFRWPHARRWAILSGGGNNGGDGYVIARLALEAGILVDLVAISEPGKLKGDAMLAYDKFTKAGGKTISGAGWDQSACDLIVDAILGTGLNQAVSKNVKQIIDQVNETSVPVLGVDLPSGLQADTGVPLGAVICADVTITFIGLKLGLFTSVGPDFAGDIYFSDLAVPEEIFQDFTPLAKRLTKLSLSGLVKSRQASTHKHQCGHVLVVGGNEGMAGAAKMAAAAAYRCGAGLVTAAVHPKSALSVSARFPEVMTRAIDDSAALSEAMARADVMVLGPGLGHDDWAQVVMAKAIESKLPMVVDADALTMLAKEPKKNSNWVLTPHPGEAARLLDTTSATVQSDRLKALTEITERYGGTCVLKGNGSLIGNQTDMGSYLCDLGSPAMASGGMGDILSGVIAALMGQGLSATDAARVGVWVHSSSGESAAAELGDRGLMATDLLTELPKHINVLVQTE